MSELTEIAKEAAGFVKTINETTHEAPAKSQSEQQKVCAECETGAGAVSACKHPDGYNAFGACKVCGAMQPTTKPVIGIADIRLGEKFCEDALAQTCEMQRESIRKMQTALDLQDSELRELRAARAGMMQNIEGLSKQLSDRKIPWVAAMAAELVNKIHNLNPDGTWPKETAIYFTVADAEKQALEIYDVFEKHLGGAK